MMQPLEVGDFSGGMTDNYLAGPPNKGQVFSNLLINNNKKPFSRNGSAIRDLTSYQTPNGNKRISHMWDYRGVTFEQSERHIYWFDTAYNELLGPTSNPGLSAAAETDHMSQTFWNNHTLMVGDSFCDPIKIYVDENGDYQLRTAGLPTIAAPTVTAGAAGANNYIYGFLYYYTYNVNGVVFEDFGPTVQVSLANAAAPNINPVAITVIPVIANGATGNYDTTVIKVKIYRSQNNGTVLNYVGEVTNGTTTYNDNATDASIVNAVTIYTTGDVVDNDPPPPAKFVHVANNTAVYGYVEEDGVEVPNRVRQAIPGDIDSCPADFFDDFPEDVMGISSVQSTFIVFCKNSTFRLEATFDEQGGGGMTHLKISDTVGCVSNDSIVQTDNGLYFCGQDGWYYCDGYRVTKVSKHLNSTYQTLVTTAAQARNIWGAYDRINKRIWFCTQLDEASLDNDSCFILDLQWGQSEEMTFTTAQAEDSFRPTCLLFRDMNMYRADNRGYVFTHDSDHFTDPKVDLLETPDNWVRQTIIYDYQSCAFNFGTSFVRKFVPKILLTLTNLTNISVQINSINDDGRLTLPLKEIRYISNVIWGDSDITWGDDITIWDKLGLIEEKRMMPATGLRCNYKQIQITNSFTIVTNSDTVGECTLDNVAKTVTLVNASSAWPFDSVDYYIYFENDDYTEGFQIVTRTSDLELVFLDTGNLAPNPGDYRWVIRGYKKSEAIEILSYVLHYKMLTDSQKSYHTSDTGNNA